MQSDREQNIINKKATGKPELGLQQQWAFSTTPQNYQGLQTCYSTTPLGLTTQDWPLLPESRAKLTLSTDCLDPMNKQKWRRWVTTPPWEEYMMGLRGQKCYSNGSFSKRKWKPSPGKPEERFPLSTLSVSIQAEKQNYSEYTITEVFNTGNWFCRRWKSLSS